MVGTIFPFFLLSIAECPKQFSIDVQEADYIKER